MRTRTALLAAALASAALATFPVVHSAGAPDRPAGVQPSAWIALGKNLGFVVQRERPGRIATQQGATVDGYFVVKRNGGWWRLDAHAESSFIPSTDR